MMDILTLIGSLDANYNMTFRPREGDRLILRHDVASSISSYSIGCAEFNAWCAGLNLKDFQVERASIEEPFIILHKDSLEYRYFRAVNAL